MLATEPGVIVPMDRIVEALWGDSPPRAPSRSVATLVSRLRATMGGDIVIGDRSGYRLAETQRVDLSHAGDLVTEAETRAQDGEPASALAAAQAALAVIDAAPVLADEPDAPWAEDARRNQAALVRRARLVAAEQAVHTGDVPAAVAAAEAAARVDRLDERAGRALMRAYAAAGEQGKALTAYERLRTGLSTELGVDPSPTSRALHVAILREQAAAVAEPAPAPLSSGQPELVGRSDEVARLVGAWERTVSRHGSVLLITGEAGIGKTRLADEALQLAQRTGGLGVKARCYEVERSLFLQPIVEALAWLVEHLPARTLREVVPDRAGALAALVPEVAALLGDSEVERGSADVERRRTYDAVARFLRRLAVKRPVMLVVDDVHQAGEATIELLHYLARRSEGSRVLVVATVRAEEDEHVVATLGAVSEHIDLGPLGPGAIARLAAAAGQRGRGTEIARRTRGHTLFVVETLRGLRSGVGGIPPSLRAVVLARVRRAGTEADDVLRAAAVLGSPFAPATIAGLLGISTEEAARRCERLLETRLTVPTGTAYEFANDLIRESLYDATPLPTRQVYHLRAADLLADNPEALARHASAAGDWRRAGRGWLAAGERALLRHAVGDADALLTKAVEADREGLDLDVAGRAHLARGRSREAMRRYDEAVADHGEALRLAREAGERELEMRALRALGGPAWSGSGRAVAQGGAYLVESLSLAEQLGDRAAQTNLLSWLAVLSANRLRFDDALTYGRQALRIAEGIGEPDVLAVALDGLKTAYAYQGELAWLHVVLDRLEPLCRAGGDLWLLQWCVFESAFPLLAHGAWDAATAKIEEALAINRRSGYAGDESWYVSNLGWIARLKGDHAEALRHGRTAVAMDSHAWWTAAAAAMYGTTLLETDRRREAIDVLERGLAGCERHRTEAYRLRCLAALAEATASKPLLLEAEAMITSIGAPAGAAWLHGADAYIAVARAWQRHDEAQRAETILTPLLAASRRTGWTAPVAPARTLADALRRA